MLVTEVLGVSWVGMRFGRGPCACSSLSLVALMQPNLHRRLWQMSASMSARHMPMLQPRRSIGRRVVLNLLATWGSSRQIQVVAHSNVWSWAHADVQLFCVRQLNVYGTILLASTHGSVQTITGQFEKRCTIIFCCTSCAHVVACVVGLGQFFAPFGSNLGGVTKVKRRSYSCNIEHLSSWRCALFAKFCTLHVALRGLISSKMWIFWVGAQFSQLIVVEHQGCAHGQ